MLIAVTMLSFLAQLSDLNISGLRAALEQSQRELPRKVNETLQPLLTLIREASGPVGQVRCV